MLTDLQQAVAAESSSLDRDAMLRWITWRRHSLQHELHQVNTEAWALCQATLTLDRLRGGQAERLELRLPSLGEPLDALGAHHLAGLQTGRTVHPQTLAVAMTPLLCETKRSRASQRHRPS